MLTAPSTESCVPICTVRSLVRSSGPHPDSINWPPYNATFQSEHLPPHRRISTINIVTHQRTCTSVQVHQQQYYSEQRSPIIDSPQPLGGPSTESSQPRNTTGAWSRRMLARTHTHTQSDLNSLRRRWFQAIIAQFLRVGGYEQYSCKIQAYYSIYYTSSMYILLYTIVPTYEWYCGQLSDECIHIVLSFSHVTQVMRLVSMMICLHM